MEPNLIFNVNKSMFYESDANGKVSILRGRYLAEFSADKYHLITGCLISGFKKKNLTDLIVLFPNLEILTIEKNSNLTSLEGIENLTNLNELRIEDCTKLSDFSHLIHCTKILKFNSELFKGQVPVLEYINKINLKNLNINGKITDLEKLINFENLDILSLEGGGCTLESLPEIPSLKVSFGLSGFPQLKDLGFLKNLNAAVRIRWWGPKGLPGLPAHLNANATFA
jgi:Leucine-rich repeat (LRR) protein